MKYLLILFSLFLMALPHGVLSQEGQIPSLPKATPQKGQSPEQQKQDSVQCLKMTQEELEKQKSEASKEQGRKTHPGLRGAAGGAARGSISGAIMDDPGRGAAIGAAGGAVRGRLRQRMMEKKQKEAKEKMGKQAFELSYTMCMKGKGYDVK